MQNVITKSTWTSPRSCAHGYCGWYGWRGVGWDGCGDLREGGGAGAPSAYSRPPCLTHWPATTSTGGPAPSSCSGLSRFSRWSSRPAWTSWGTRGSTGGRWCGPRLACCGCPPCGGGSWGSWWSSPRSTPPWTLCSWSKSLGKKRGGSTSWQLDWFENQGSSV